MSKYVSNKNYIRIFEVYTLHIGGKRTNSNILLQSLFHSKGIGFPTTSLFEKPRYRKNTLIVKYRHII